MTERKRGGRKPLPAEQRRQHKSLYLSVELCQWLDGQEHPSRTAEDAIRAWKSKIDSEIDQIGQKEKR